MQSSCSHSIQTHQTLTVYRPKVVVTVDNAAIAKAEIAHALNLSESQVRKMLQNANDPKLQSAYQEYYWKKNIPIPLFEQYMNIYYENYFIKYQFANS